MLNLNELYEKISANFWKSTQVAAWAEAHFFRRASHKQTRTGTTDANLPIILNSDGYVDTSFVNGTAHTELIADTVGAMVTGNTETGITVTYQDADNTLDFVLSDEYIQDVVGAMGFSSGVNPVVYDGYDDGTGTYSWSLQTDSITTSYLVDDNVTNAKLANMAQATIKGRASGAGTGDPTDLSAAQVRTLTGLEAGGAGDIWVEKAGDTMTGQLLIKLTTSASQLHLERFTANAGGPSFAFHKSRAATIDAHTIVQNGDDLATFIFRGSDGSAFQNAAQIVVEVDGTPGASDMPGRMVFYTTPDGSATPAEALRLDRNQNATFAGTVTATGINVGEDTLTIYDEGTWTPAITSSNNNATIGVTATGIFRRWNDFVWFSAYVDITAITAAGTGSYRFSLPFTAAASPTVQTFSAIQWIDALNVIPLYGHIQANVAYCGLHNFSTGPIISGDLSTSSNYVYSGGYYIA
jgi:hypothetical protein